MANVKITDLPNLQSPADADRFIIDDVNVPQTKSVTFANLRAQIDTIATSNVNTVSSNVDAVESRRASNAVIQTAIEARRVANIAGAVSSITTADLTASRALVSDSSGKVAVSAVTSTELAHLDGVSGALQTQLDAKAALAGATFTGQVNLSDDLVVTGNLIVSGDTTISEISAVEARRVANIAGAISSVLTVNLTANKILTSDGSGKITVTTLAAGDLGAAVGKLSNTSTDFGLLDSANLASDAFTIVVGDLVVFDMLTSPAGEVDDIDLVAFS
tara:strand:- start:2361 stop:3185 length:825 start_codon:yes stop_codon:yes gene_type:complete